MPERGFFVPPLALVLLCLVPIGALFIEGAMLEWSALLMREDKGASPFLTGVTFAAFAIGMAAARLSGDGLAERFGPRPVIVASGLPDGRRRRRLRAGAGALGVAADGGGGRGRLRQHLSADDVDGRADPGAAARAQRRDAGARRIHRLPDRPAGDRGVAHAIGLPWALAVLAPLGLVPLAMLRRLPAPEAQPQ